MRHFRQKIKQMPRNTLRLNFCNLKIIHIRHHAIIQKKENSKK